jgi:hypothetical protein
MTIDDTRDAGTFVRRYRSSLIIAAVALVVALVWAVVAFAQLGSQIRELPRTPVPGELTLEIEEPTGLVVYDERRSWTTPIGGPYPDIEVEGPDGEVEVAPYRAVMNYRWWRMVGQARATFDAGEPGTYTVRAEGDPPADARVTVGPSFVTPMIAALIGPAVVLATGLLVAAVIAAHLASRRRA